MYLVSIGPGLVLALVDWLVAKTPIPAVIGTTLFAYGALVLFLAWDGSAKDILALGLIGAIPAAVCSWLSSGKPNGRAQWVNIYTSDVCSWHKAAIPVALSNVRF
jgi:hypothetical protein